MAVGNFWIAPYSNTYIKPVCTTPSVNKAAQALCATGRLCHGTSGANNNAPVVTWISAIKCGGTAFRRLMISAASAYRNAAPRARAIPVR